MTTISEALNIEAVRQYFPAFSYEGNKDLVFCENAGGSFVNKFVLDKHHHYMANTRVQPYGTYSPSREAGAAMDASYEAFAAMHGVTRDEVMFGPSTSMNSYILAQSLSKVLSKGDEIIVTNQDHEANGGAWRRLAEHEMVISEWSIDPSTGILNPEDLIALISDKTKVICFPHCSNLIGAANDVKAIVQSIRAKKADIKVIVDGVAWAPHAHLDFIDLDVDAYMYSLYKTYGPHLGLLYVRKTWLETLSHQGHFFNEAKGIAYKLTPAGPHHNDIACASGVVDYYQAIAKEAGINTGDVKSDYAGLSEHVEAQETLLMGVLLDYLNQKDEITVYGGTENNRAKRAPTVGFSSSSQSSTDIATALRKQQIGCSSGHFYAYRLCEALGLDTNDGVVRISLLHYNSIEEAQTIVRVLDEVLN